MKIGSHESERTLLFDTGSNALWLTSDHCTLDRCDNKHSTPYNLDESKSGKYYQEVKIGPDVSQITYYKQQRARGGEVEIKYGLGLVRGVKAIDRVCFVGHAIASQGAGKEKVDVELCNPEQQLVSVDYV